MKEWVGFCTVEFAPSPKFQNHAVGLLEEVSVNVTRSWRSPGNWIRGETCNRVLWEHGDITRFNQDIPIATGIEGYQADGVDTFIRIGMVRVLQG